MGVFETELRQMRIEIKKEFQEIRKMIAAYNVREMWVKQPAACALLNVKPRQLANIRVHMKDGKKVGCVSWKKGTGKNILYYKPDIEKYNGAVTIMN